MTETVSEAHGVRMLHCSADGATLADEGGAVELVALALAQRADMVVVPVRRLDPRFFTLSTGLAGAIVQKLVNYRLRLTVVGDVRSYVEASDALRDYVYETNRGRQVWFVADSAELDARLAAAARTAQTRDAGPPATG
jgi:uncharacterized protein DUF4180